MGRALLNICALINTCIYGANDESDSMFAYTVILYRSFVEIEEQKDKNQMKG